MSTTVAVVGGARDRVAWPHVLQLTGIEVSVKDGEVQSYDRQ